VTGHSRAHRPKVARDLSDPAARAQVRDEQIAYYRERAPWYDSVYDCTGEYDRGAERNAAWHAQLDIIRAALDAAPLRGDCVELAPGTGYWTARYADRVDHVTLLDASPEMLDIARGRLPDNVTCEVTDLWDWHPTRTWDCAVSCFFFEHVPDEVFPSLVATVADVLPPGGVFFIGEASLAHEEPHIEIREVHEHPFHVVERRRTPAEYAAGLAAAGFECDIVNESHVIAVTATKHSA
jgi:demethylmenaquinone methyltransferase/2-methoxy-6-polyprenyl-1,4-benzoquinol methylase